MLPVSAPLPPWPLSSRFRVGPRKPPNPRRTPRKGLHVAVVPWRRGLATSRTQQAPAGGSRCRADSRKTCRSRTKVSASGVYGSQPQIGEERAVAVSRRTLGRASLGITTIASTGFGEERVGWQPSVDDEIMALAAEVVEIQCLLTDCLRRLVSLRSDLDGPPARLVGLPRLPAGRESRGLPSGSRPVPGGAKASPAP